MFKCVASIIVSSSLLLSSPIPNSIYNIDIPYIYIAANVIKKPTDKELQIAKDKYLQEKEVRCLAENMYFEARGEPLEGQIAVAAVTLNRAKKKYTAKTVCDVVKFKVKNICAFSWTCDDKEDVIRDKKTFTELHKIAYNMYGKFKSGKQYDQTDGALHFHASYSEPEWMEAKVRLVKIGEHIFYR